MQAVKARYSWLRNLILNKRLPNVIILSPLKAEDDLVNSVVKALFCNHYDLLTKYAVTQKSEKIEMPEEWPAFCGKCNSCRMLNNHQHPDYLEICFEKLSKQADIWPQLQAKLYLSPFQSSHRIFHFSRAQFMEPIFSNQLLKALEDSPTFNLFIFSCDQSRHLLSTIRSRGVEVRLPPSTEAQELEKINLQKNLAERIDQFDKLEQWWQQLVQLIGQASSTITNRPKGSIDKEGLEILRKQWLYWTQSISERALAQDLLLHLYLKVDHQLQNGWDLPTLRQYLLLSHQLEKGLQAFSANQNVKMQLDHFFRGLEQQLSTEQ